MNVLKFNQNTDTIIASVDEPLTEVTREFWFKTQDPESGLLSAVRDSNKGTDRDIYLSGGNL